MTLFEQGMPAHEVTSLCLALALQMPISPETGTGDQGGQNGAGDRQAHGREGGGLGKVWRQDVTLGPDPNPPPWPSQP